MTPTPAAILELRGTARPDRVRPDLPSFDLVNEFPKPPAYLGRDGKSLWRELGPQLVRAGVLQVVDLYSLEQTCYAWNSFREKARLRQPITAAENATLRAMFSEFGMTPAARRRVSAAKGAAKPEAGNRFAKYGNRGAA